MPLGEHEYWHGTRGLRALSTFQGALILEAAGIEPTPGRRCPSGIFIGQERAKQLVVRAERAPAGWRRSRAKRCPGPPDSLLMSIRAVGRPAAERLGHLETGRVVH